MFYQLHSLASVGNIRKEYGENFSFPPHLHYCFEIITLLSGEMTVTIDGTDYHLKKNDSLLIFPNQLHSLSSQESEHLLYIFDPKMVQAFNIKRKDVVPADNRLVLDDYLISLLKEICPQNLADRYGEDFSLEGIAKKRGFIVSGGQLNLDRCATAIVEDFRKGRIGKVTLD